MMSGLPYQLRIVNLLGLLLPMILTAGVVQSLMYWIDTKKLPALLNLILWCVSLAIVLFWILPS